MFFNQDEKSYLTGTQIADQLDEDKASMKNDYNIMTRKLPRFYYTLTEYLEMRKCVCSRIFDIKIEGRQTLGLVPYADMLNHGSKPNCEWAYSDQKGGFAMKAL